MDPYTVGGRTYDPEIPLRRGLAGRRAELTLADELGVAAEGRREARGEAAEGRKAERTRTEADRVRQQKIDAMVQAGVDPNRAAAIVDSGSEPRELFPDQFRTSWPTPRSDEERKPIPSLEAATRTIFLWYGVPDSQGDYALPPEASPEWVQAAVAALQAGERVPPLPSRQIGSIDLSALFGRRQVPYRPGAAPRTEVPMRPGMARPAPALEPETPRLSAAQADYDALVAQFGAEHVKQRLGPRPR
jgi:hypothetical protein